MELSPVAQAFVGQWDEDRHLLAMASKDLRYYMAHDVAGESAGYVILRGLVESGDSIELKRIVVSTPGKGLGRRILEEILSIVFRELGAHRVFLDVFENNERARHLYESVGFQYEGVLREAALRDGVFCNLRLMSMLVQEYEQRARPFLQVR